jgi:hypothetical protein
VYPNPAQTAITIDAGTSLVDQVVIRDVTGKVIYKDDKPFQGPRSIKTESWDEGIYFVEMSGAGFRVTRKIVKQ